MILRVNYVAMLLCIVALLFLGDVQAGVSNAKIYKVSATQISEHIKATTGERRAIVFYAHWCPQCVKKMPLLIELERKKPGSIIAISVDDDFKRFSRYIKRLGDIPFKVRLYDGSDKILYNQLKAFGIEPRDGVPDIIFLDENNQTAFQGNYDVEDVARFLDGEW